MTMQHERRIDLFHESVELDYRDHETLEIRIHLETFDVVLTIMRRELEGMEFDQQ